MWVELDALFMQHSDLVHFTLGCKAGLVCAPGHCEHLVQALDGQVGGRG